MSNYPAPGGLVDASGFKIDTKKNILAVTDGTSNTVFYTTRTAVGERGPTGGTSPNTKQVEKERRR